MKNVYLKSVLMLFLVCFAVAAALALANNLTVPIINEANLKAETESLVEVLPNSKGFDKIEITDTTPSTITGIYKDRGGNGYALTISTFSQYSKDNMQFSVGINKNGEIEGIKLTAYSESKDFGADFPQKFIGKDKSLSGIDTVAGVTYSSKAFISAVNDAFAVIESLKEG